MKDLIFTPYKASGRISKAAEVYDIIEACQKGLYKPRQPGLRGYELLHIGQTIAPNLSLNIQGSADCEGSWWLFALFGIVLQSSVLICSGMVTYYWRLPQNGQEIPVYAYPCFLAGTLAVSFALLMCSHVIEALTKEVSFQPTASNTQKSDFQIARLQPSSTASSQVFPAVALFNHHNNSTLRTSYLRPSARHTKSAHLKRSMRMKRLDMTAVTGTFLALVGFFTQVLGLHVLHYSVTVMNVGASAAMTFIRSWVRRNLNQDVDARHTPAEHQRAWLAEYLTGCRIELFCGSYDDYLEAGLEGTPRMALSQDLTEKPLTLSLEDKDDQPRLENLISLQRKLHTLLPPSRDEPTCTTLHTAKLLALSLENVLSALHDRSDLFTLRRKRTTTGPTAKHGLFYAEEALFQWTIDLLAQYKEPYTRLQPRQHTLSAIRRPSNIRASDNWSVDSDELAAILALSLSTITYRRKLQDTPTTKSIPALPLSPSSPILDHSDQNQPNHTLLILSTLRTPSNPSNPHAWPPNLHNLSRYLDTSNTRLFYIAPPDAASDFVLYWGPHNRGRDRAVDPCRYPVLGMVNARTSSIDR